LTVEVAQSGPAVVEVTGPTTCGQPLGPAPQTVYWDPNHLGAGSEIVGAGQGSAGTWDIDDPYNNCWYAPALGQDVPWTDGANAIFAVAAGGPVSIFGPVNPASITIESGGYTIAGSTSGGSLAFDGTYGGSAINLDLHLQATISAPISVSGGDNMTIGGPGNLTVSGGITVGGGSQLILNGSLYS
jgi:hypothetical protein